MVVLDPQGVVLLEKTKNIQNRAARSITSNYYETGSLTGILEKIKIVVSQEKEERQ